MRQAIADLNFYPDTNARTLGSGRSSLFGLIISDITNPYFPELVKAFEDIAVQHGKEVLIANTNYDPIRMEHCVIRMLQRKVDGVAILTSEMEERLIRGFSRRKIPLVFMDALHSAGRGQHRIKRQHWSASTMSPASAPPSTTCSASATATSASSAARSPSAPPASARTSSTARSRSTACPPTPPGCRRATTASRAAHHAMQRILAGPTRPTAILASNDLTAIGAMGAIHEHGLRIPEDLSVMGFDGIELSGYMQPGLTTMLVPRGEVSTLAFRSLLQHHEGSDRNVGENERSAGPREHIVEPSLLKRGSTASPKNSVISTEAKRTEETAADAPGPRHS